MHETTTWVPVFVAEEDLPEHNSDCGRVPDLTFVEEEGSMLTCQDCDYAVMLRPDPAPGTGLTPETPWLILHDGKPRASGWCQDCYGD